MFVDKREEAGKSKGYKWIKAEDRDHVPRLRMLSCLIGGLYPVIVQRNIQEARKFENEGLQKDEIFYVCWVIW